MDSHNVYSADLWAVQLMPKTLFVDFPGQYTSTGPGGLMVCVCIYVESTRRLNRQWLREAGD